MTASVNKQTAAYPPAQFVPDTIIWFKNIDWNLQRERARGGINNVGLVLALIGEKLHDAGRFLAEVWWLTSSLYHSSFFWWLKLTNSLCPLTGAFFKCALCLYHMTSSIPDSVSMSDLESYAKKAATPVEKPLYDGLTETEVQELAMETLRGMSKKCKDPMVEKCMMLAVAASWIRWHTE